MKRRCFTIVELMTVLAIVGVLIALCLTAYSGIIRMAHKRRAQARLSQILMAVSSYHTTYMVLPFTTQAGTSDNVVVSDTSSPSFSDLLATLKGTDTSLNPRGITFLEPDADGQYRDPWEDDPGKSGFVVVLDLDYDNQLWDSQVAGAGTLTKTIAIWSKGRDRADDTGSDGNPVNRDNVTSWE